MAVDDIVLSLLRLSGRIAPVKVNPFSHIIMASLAGVGSLLKGISPDMDAGDNAHGALRVVYALLTDWNSESCFPPRPYSDDFCFMFPVCNGAVQVDYCQSMPVLGCICFLLWLRA